MNEKDEKGKITADEKLEKQENGASGPILLFFIVGLVASLLVGWVAFPAVLYSEKKQPIDFNHRLHNDLVDNGCESCHYLREDGTFAGVPTLESCVECHDDVQGVSPEEEKFVTQYVWNDREVPWLVYSRQPDCVFFSHAAHLKMAEMECVTCHGPIGESESLPIYESNRISGYSRAIWGKNMLGLNRNPWDSMKMDDCAECHEEVGKGSSVQTTREACFVCHK